ncbi:uncharacterized protein PAC_12941 [Phialocephala subalpina]|uniref:VOC domain-containing protein n=1 Tax=Phialocephala subalpina TaxID=576137 RepID=A0A1L7XDD8_9HELO|nr:uncharacterized protein PAC_12941 [Phialocephala subalpina]
MTSTDSASTWKIPPVGSPCWIEIPAVDVQACKKFYTSLFPTWEFKASTEKYPEERIAMWSFAAPSGLSGGIVQVAADCKTAELKNGMGFTIYHFVESIEEAQKRAEELGGKTLCEKTPEGDNGWYMYLLDVAGNRFGIYQLKEGKPEQ